VTAKKCLDLGRQACPLNAAESLMAVRAH